MPRFVSASAWPRKSRIGDLARIGPQLDRIVGRTGLRDCDSLLLRLYVPPRAKIVSPAAASPMALPNVANGLPIEPLFESLPPVGAT